MAATFLLLLVVAGYGVQAGPFGYGFPEYRRSPHGDSIDKVSIKLLKEAYASATDKNVVASPIAVLTLLSLYAMAAKGESRQEILNFLDEKNSDAAVYNKKNLQDRLATTQLSFKNSLYSSKDYTIVEAFLLSATYDLRFATQKIDFQNVKDAVARINKWAREETRGHITDAVSEDQIDPATAIAFFNVIFFQGHWHVPFNASETTEKDFHIDKNTVMKKPTMSLKKTLLYGQNQKVGAKFLELPYQEHGFRMIITLPDEINGLPNVIQNLSETGVLEDVFSLISTEVELELPRFEIKSELDLNTILPKLGVSKIFSEPTTGIMKEKPVVVDKAFQKAFIRVDEEGAMAGAFTGMIAVPTSLNYKPPPPIQFKVDRPFLFTILYEEIVIFSGTYTH